MTDLIPPDHNPFVAAINEGTNIVKEVDEGIATITLGGNSIEKLGSTGEFENHIQARRVG